MLFVVLSLTIPFSSSSVWRAQQVVRTFLGQQRSNRSDSGTVPNLGPEKWRWRSTLGLSSIKSIHRSIILNRKSLSVKERAGWGSFPSRYITLKVDRQIIVDRREYIFFVGFRAPSFPCGCPYCLLLRTYLIYSIRIICSNKASTLVFIRVSRAKSSN